MKIKQVSVSNFRSIKAETLQCQDLIVMVGRNGSGKSTFLKALEFFYAENVRLDDDDFYNRNSADYISIEVTFSDLTAREQTDFEDYIQDSLLRVEKRFSIQENFQKYFGFTKKHPGAEKFRKAITGAEIKTEYQDLQQTMGGLPSYQNIAQAKEAVKEWERANPQLCSISRDEGDFFGFEGSPARLDRYTRYIFVPAVKEASEDATEGRNSNLTQLLDLVVKRDALINNPEIDKLLFETQSRYSEITSRSQKAELDKLQEELSRTLQIYAGNVKARLSWAEAEVSVPKPVADVKLVEDDYKLEVSKTGHGVQRAFILAMVQHLAHAQSATLLQGEEFPNIVLGIEEPELYQHPVMQRNIAKVLLKLATQGIAGIANQTQVFYGTHSPLFINLEWLESLRLFKKVSADKGKPKETKIFALSLDDILKELNEAQQPDETFTIEGLKARLRAAVTPLINEGFFADGVVLVEGPEDLAIVQGMANQMGINLENLGISVLPCDGKENLKKPLAIFRSLGIRVYPIWDSDYGVGGDVHTNHLLLRLMGHSENDYPEFISDNSACFKTNMTEVFRSTCGDDFYDTELAECSKLLGMQAKQAKKSDYVISRIIEKSGENGNNLESFQELLKKISAIVD